MTSSHTTHIKGKTAVRIKQRKRPLWSSYDDWCVGQCTKQNSVLPTDYPSINNVPLNSVPNAINVAVFSVPNAVDYISVYQLQQSAHLWTVYKCSSGQCTKCNRLSINVPTATDCPFVLLCTNHHSHAGYCICQLIGTAILDVLVTHSSGQPSPIWTSLHWTDNGLLSRSEQTNSGELLWGRLRLLDKPNDDDNSLPWRVLHSHIIPNMLR